MKWFSIVVSLLIIQGSASICQYSRYVEDVYDCSDMSEDIYKELKDIGVDCKVVGVITDRDNNIGHSYLIVNVFGLEIPFESVFLCVPIHKWNEYVAYEMVMLE